VDIKSLHQAIKELRAELDRVDLAIQRIEVIAEAAGRAQKGAKAPSAAKPPPTEPSGAKD